MTRQCVACSIALPSDRRSPHCERCRVDYQRRRNREKVRAFRNRTRVTGANQALAGESRGPNQEELAWLEAINPDLEEPIRRAHGLLDQGRRVTDGEVTLLALGALSTYDKSREQFESEVTPETEPIAESWREYFESVRRTLG